FLQVTHIWPSGLWITCGQLPPRRGENDYPCSSVRSVALWVTAVRRWVALPPCGYPGAKADSPRLCPAVHIRQRLDTSPQLPAVSHRLGITSSRAHSEPLTDRPGRPG